MLASHADRERAVDVLKAGFSEGRLPRAEFDQRTMRAYQARTVGELALLVADLPQGPMPMPPNTSAVPVPPTFLPAAAPRTNGKAVGALLCGMLTAMTAGLTAIPAVILGHSARAEIRRTGESGDGVAMAGLILGWLSVAGWTVFLTIMLVAGTSSR
jgi:hypothetical protein